MDFDSASLDSVQTNQAHCNLPVAQPSHDDWQETCLRLRPNLKFQLRRQGGKEVAVIEDEIRGKFFQVGEAEYKFISRLDGLQTIREVISTCASEPDEPVTEELAKKVCAWLMQNNLLLVEGESIERQLTTMASARQKSKLLSWLNPICFRISLGNPDKILTQLLPSTRWLFSLPVAIVWLILAIFAITCLGENWERFSASSRGILAPTRWIWLLMAWVFLKIIHEMAHGICCKKYGGEVKEAGTLILLFAPMAFVDVTSSWRFSSRWQRICVSAAGMYVELAVAFLAILVWSRCEPGLLADLCYNLIVMASLTSILFNANPLMRFDGYYILADMLDVVNLYNRGREWVWKQLDRIVLGITAEAAQVSRREAWIIAIYGLCATCWKVILTFTLLIAASALFDGVGLILAAVGGFFWVVMPTIQQSKRITKLAAQGSIEKRRVFVSLGTSLLFLFAIFFVIRAPAFAVAPAIVKHRNEQIVRATGDGFLAEILVEDGQTVSKGQTLVRLSNPELENEAFAIKCNLAAAKIRSRIQHDQGELAKYQAELGNILSLEQQLNEIEQQISQQKVVAKIDGTVFAREIRNKINHFVHQGDLIMTVANDHSKQILVSIAEDSIDTLRPQLHRPVHVSLPGEPIVRARFDSIQPRATDRLDETALRADAGGPLPVKPVSTDEGQEIRLIRPRFIAELEIDPNVAYSLKAGQTGEAFITTEYRTLGWYMVVGLQRWFKEKMSQATEQL